MRWFKPVTRVNSRSVPVTCAGTETASAKVLFLERRYDPLAGGEPVTAGGGDAKYILAEAGAPLGRDVIIQDNDNNSWRADSPEFVTGGGETICQLLPVEPLGKNNPGIYVPKESNGVIPSGEGGGNPENTRPANGTGGAEGKGGGRKTTAAGNTAPDGNG